MPVLELSLELAGCLRIVDLGLGVRRVFHHVGAVGFLVIAVDLLLDVGHDGERAMTRVRGGTIPTVKSRCTYASPAIGGWRETY